MKTMYFLALATIVLVAISVPVFASEADDLIESAFKNSYACKTYLKDDNITIGSKDGAVALSGSVTNDSHKVMAQDVAEALAGVKSVNNQIKIAPDSPSEFSDLWVGTKVKTSLLYHRNVNGTATEVNVNEGIVTLKGEASSDAQRELTAQYAKDIGGVKSLNNEMTVAAAPKEEARTLNEAIDDASITAQVKGALLIHSSTSALKTNVSTNMCVVTVGGVAKNAAEKELVTLLSEDIHGVKSVVNNMTVEEKKKS
jgi:hyperosmotically inducible periplasmic protein